MPITNIEDFVRQLEERLTLIELNRLSFPLDGNSQVNFQLINKSGTYYHGLNLMTWAAVCMSPRIAKIITLAYYNTNILCGMDNKHEHGREKLESDMLVVKNANQIKEVVNHYT